MLLKSEESTPKTSKKRKRSEEGITPPSKKSKTTPITVADDDFEEAPQGKKTPATTPKVNHKPQVCNLCNGWWKEKHNRARCFRNKEAKKYDSEEYKELRKKYEEQKQTDESD